MLMQQFEAAAEKTIRLQKWMDLIKQVESIQPLQLDPEKTIAMWMKMSGRTTHTIGQFICWYAALTSPHAQSLTLIRVMHDPHQAFHSALFQVAVAATQHLRPELPLLHSHWTVDGWSLIHQLARSVMAKHKIARDLPFGKRWMDAISLLLLDVARYIDVLFYQVRSIPTQLLTSAPDPPEQSLSPLAASKWDANVHWFGTIMSAPVMHKQVSWHDEEDPHVHWLMQQLGPKVHWSWTDTKQSSPHSVADLEPEVDRGQVWLAISLSEECGGPNDVQLTRRLQEHAAYLCTHCPWICSLVGTRIVEDWQRIHARLDSIKWRDKQLICEQGVHFATSLLYSPVKLAAHCEEILVRHVREQSQFAISKEFVQTRTFANFEAFYAAWWSQKHPLEAKTVLLVPSSVCSAILIVESPQTSCAARCAEWELHPLEIRNAASPLVDLVCDELHAIRYSFAVKLPHRLRDMDKTIPNDIRTRNRVLNAKDFDIYVRTKSAGWPASLVTNWTADGVVGACKARQWKIVGETKSSYVMEVPANEQLSWSQQSLGCLGTWQDASLSQSAPDLPLPKEDIVYSVERELATAATLSRQCQLDCSLYSSGCPILGKLRAALSAATQTAPISLSKLQIILEDSHAGLRLGVGSAQTQLVLSVPELDTKDTTHSSLHLFSRDAHCFAFQSSPSELRWAWSNTNEPFLSVSARSLKWQKPTALSESSMLLFTIDSRTLQVCTYSESCAVDVDSIGLVVVASYEPQITVAAARVNFPSLLASYYKCTKQRLFSGVHTIYRPAQWSLPSPCVAWLGIHLIGKTKS